MSFFFFAKKQVPELCDAVSSDWGGGGIGRLGAEGLGNSHVLQQF